MNKIDQSTLIPMGVVGTALGALLGGAVWLTTVYLSTTANAQKINEVKQTTEVYLLRQEKMYESIIQIQKDVAEIKGEIKNLKK